MKIELEKPPPLLIDPLVKALTEKKIDQDIKEYQSLLDNESSEQNVHDFLASHSYFFNGILRLYGESPIYSKVKLGAEYEVDFACFDTGSFGPEWYLIEIEAPAKKLFTKSGDPTSDLTHAIQQVRDWHTWIHENLNYVRKLMPLIEYPLGFVFIGRRSHLTNDTKRKLRRLAHDHRMFMRIHTLDWLSGTASSVKYLVRTGKGGTWPVPMHALSHSELAKGKPELAHGWLNHPNVSHAHDAFQNLLLNQRNYSYLNLAEYRDDDEEN
ncbi:MAG: DUF4263 domain-containing protein [Deltaproteobacteria bacterium]|nr:DUF4263 domain-containing protein [Deltaproteobacteria bacterium]